MLATIYLKVNEDCNLRCDHCFNSERFSKKYPELNIEKIKTFFKNIQNNFSSVHIIITGGEPMLSDLNKIKELYKENDIFIDQTYSIQTNLAYKLTEEHLDLFNTILKTKQIGTSYDGPSRFEKGSATSNLWENNLRILNKEYAITVLVTLSNWLLTQSPKDFLDYLGSLGIRYLNFNQITKHGSAKSLDEISIVERDKWLNELLDYSLMPESPRIGNMVFDGLVGSVLQNKQHITGTRSCQRRIFTLGLDGSVKGCQNTDSYWGNLTDNIIHSKIRNKEILEEVSINKECLKCDMFKYCNGDCYLMPVCSGYYSLLKRISLNPSKYQKLLIHEVLNERY